MYNSMITVEAMVEFISTNPPSETMADGGIRIEKLCFSEDGILRRGIIVAPEPPSRMGSLGIKMYKIEYI